ncbi:MAG: HD domain-containing protein [Candidatus Kapaibacteriota bacterium]|jgi:exopolyphosphatase/guanosine-5'-triphosphate,3'-diphosphate pyrophosphatase
MEIRENDRAQLIAAIDVGTNSFHLIIASVDSRGMLNIVLREKEVVRLGASAGDIKYLTEDAIERGVRTLKRFADIAKSKGAEIRAVATSAVREALNANDFIDLVKKETGIEIEVVSGVEEGRLIYLGALHSLPIVNQKALIIDIGGGSTETVIGKDGETIYVHSEKLGAIRLSVKFELQDEVDENKIKECRRFIRGVWAPIFNKINQIGYDTLVGTAGTILNIAVMTLMSNGKPVPDILNGYTLERKDILKTIRRIIEAKNLKERKQIQGMDPQRADIIVGGALILEYALENAVIDRMHISTFGLREGIVYDTLEKRKEIETLKHLGRLRESSIYSIAQKYGVNLQHSYHIKNIALKLFDATQHLHNLGIKEREWLEAAAILHDVGYLISVEQHHKHSYYIISHCIMPGFTKEESEIIANIARYHRKSHPKKRHENFQKLSEEKQETVKILAGILRIAEGIDRRQIQAVKDIVVIPNTNSITIKLIPANNSDVPDVELWGAERRKLLFEESMGIKVNIALEL